jgi:hypothetical protein
MFSGLGAEDLARLPVRVVQELLGNNELEVIKKCHINVIYYYGLRVSTKLHSISLPILHELK